jgi:hypothetical protein
VRLEKLERQQRNLEADWDEWFDKFRRLYARLSKRVERDQQQEAEAASEVLEVAPDGTNHPQPVGGTAHLAARFRR